MSFEPTSGYSTTRTSTVFSDGENQQRAEVVASLNGDWVLESYSTDKSSAVVTDGVNKQRAVVTYNLNGGSGGSGGGSSGGDYLPLSGGTLTGQLLIDYKSEQGLKMLADSTGRYVAFKAGGSIFSGALSILFTSQTDGYTIYQNAFFPSNPSKTLGNSSYKWGALYAQKLNNGADIAIPTEGGTLARIEDIDEVVGNISTLLDAINGESI